MRRLLLLFLCTLVSVLAACSDSTRPIGDDIRGQVVDPQGTPVTGVAILLQHSLASELSQLPDTQLPGPSSIVSKSSQIRIQWSQREAGRALVWIASYCDVDTLRMLFDRESQIGVYSVLWDGRDDAGRILPDGAYWVHLLHDGDEDLVQVTLLHSGYGDLVAGDTVAPMAVTDAHGFFSLASDCLPLELVIPETDESGTVIGTDTITRQVRVWAFDEQSGALASSDWLTVDADTGATITIVLDH
jgi:hypothetical protein